ncbi:hypothetical protein HGM15179_018053 [Zosterops borbonicus]|uniref:ATP synthase lipid-binding protein n=1 Tax=Zosterops borbonicus TaxID=364589 RepID=A0A8K1FZQ2_9PASS|nr:hypothetical protein HGM15179_018053 [Zosterops borbonicus]
MDSVLKKNFVEWLLARREKKSQDLEGPFKRDTEPQKSPEGQKIWDLGTLGTKNFLDWVWKNRENSSFPALEGSEGLKEFLEQEFLLWLVSGEICKATNPSLKQQLFSYAILGFALSEAMGLFCLMVAFLILFAM